MMDSSVSDNKDIFLRKNTPKKKKKNFCQI